MLNHANNHTQTRSSYLQIFMKSKRTKVLVIIGAIIWFGLCGFGFYKSIRSDDYFLMLHYKQRLETRNHYIKLCDISTHDKLEGKVSHVKNLKGGARIIGIKIFEESSIGFLTDYQPSQNSNIFSIHNLFMTYRIEYNYKGETINIGDKVSKPLNSNKLLFTNSTEVIPIDFQHYYSENFTSCEDALSMDFNKEFEKYLYHLDKSDSRDKLSPHVLKELELEE